MIGTPHTLNSLLLFADAVRTKFTWSRIHENSDWILPVVVLVVVAIFVRKWYERDARELGRGIGWFLTILRSLVFISLFFLYLQPEWRVETERRIESRAAVLVDTSLSMALTDPEEGAPAGKTKETRAEQIEKLLDKTDFLKRLRETHHVDVYTFGSTLRPITTLKKFNAEDEPSTDADNAKNAKNTKDGEPASEDNQDDAESKDSSDTSNPSKKTPAKPLDWKAVLKPVDGETRLGDAMSQLLDEVRDAPVSGVVLLSEGGSNAGSDPVGVVEAANAAKVKLFPVGIGSDELPPNVRVSRLTVPPRAQPGDGYTVTGYVQARKLEGKDVKVELLLKGDHPKDKPTLLEEQSLKLGADGETSTIRFEMLPTEPGRQVYLFRVVLPPDVEDHHPADNFAEAQIEIIDRPLRVLLFAGGPMREYHFMRNLLHRDPGVEVDVLLQSSHDNVSQDANKVLDEFPEMPEDLFRYDCIIAFDPDWRELTDQQIEMVERWVAEQGGGLILFAGAVNLGEKLDGWLQDARTKPIQDLYPVIFSRSYTSDISMHICEDPWTPKFTREGTEAEFLRLDDDPAKSEELWKEFTGFYSFLPVESLKPSATIYAQFSDPTVTDERGNIYFAGQFYGSGRTFYAGSAELWRLRQLDDKYHERITIKLLRHVAQGRLLLDSPRGVLMVDHEQYMPGDMVEVRARLNDAQYAPLAAAKIEAEMKLPDESLQKLTLVPDPSRPGTFLTRFPAMAEGTYQVVVTMPDDPSVQLERRFLVKMPDRERENPVRNDALLSHLADATQGRYYLGIAAAAATGPDSLVAQLPDRTKTIILPSPPDTKWIQTWLMWLMLLMVGLLSIEWTIRRLLKLA